MDVTERRNVVVSLDGNIGSGKSSLARRVASLLAKEAKEASTWSWSLSLSRSRTWSSPRPFAVIEEPVDLWTKPTLPDGRSMLQAFYADKRENAFAFQLFVLKTRLDQLLDVPEGVRVLSERCLTSHDKIFARMARDEGHINDAQELAYRAMHDTAALVAGFAGPSAVVYLRTSPEVCARRCAARARVGEDSMPEGLLLHLHVLHEDFVGSMRDVGVPVLELDGDAEVVTEEDADGMAARVVSFLRGVGSSRTIGRTGETRGSASRQGGQRVPLGARCLQFAAAFSQIAAACVDFVNITRFKLLRCCHVYSGEGGPFSCAYSRHSTRP